MQLANRSLRKKILEIERDWLRQGLINAVEHDFKGHCLTPFHQTFREFLDNVRRDEHEQTKISRWPENLTGGGVTSKCISWFGGGQNVADITQWVEFTVSYAKETMNPKLLEHLLLDFNIWQILATGDRGIAPIFSSLGQSSGRAAVVLMSSYEKIANLLVNWAESGTLKKSSGLPYERHDFEELADSIVDVAQGKNDISLSILL